MAEPVTSPARRRRRPGSRVVAVVGVLFGAVVALGAAGRPWFSTTVAGLPGPDLITTNGRSIAPGAPALALVAAAGAIVLATAGRVVRTVVAALLTLAGASIVVLSTAPLRDPTRALESAVATATGTTGDFVAFVGDISAWPVVSAAGGVAVLVGGLVAVVGGRGWAEPSRRYDREPVPGGRPREGADTPVVTGKESRLDAWDRLSEGEDPTD